MFSIVAASISISTNIPFSPYPQHLFADLLMIAVKCYYGFNLHFSAIGVNGHLALSVFFGELSIQVLAPPTSPLG